MPEFILNTDGTVNIPCPVSWAPKAESIVRWRDLDYFTQGYIEAVFFTECEPGTDASSHDPETQSSLHGDCGFADLAPEALERIVAQCAAFQAENAADLDQAYSETDYDSEQAGRDFWFTRNGHGVGFWDRDALDWYSADQVTKLGDKLSEAAHAAGEVYVYLGDDGRVYHDGGFTPPAAASGANATAEVR